MARKVKIDYEKVFSINPYEMSIGDLKKNLEKKVRRANERMRAIEKAGNYSYAYQAAMRELDRQGRRRFSYAGNNREDLVKKLYQVEAFLSHETSKIRELRRIQERAYETLAEKARKRTGIDLRELNLNRNDFYRFLNSTEGKDFIKEYGSKQVIDDIATALTDKTLKLEKVIDQYREFMGTHLPLEAVEYKRKGKIGTYDQYRKMLEAKKRG